MFLSDLGRRKMDIVIVAILIVLVINATFSQIALSNFLSVVKEDSTVNQVILEDIRSSIGTSKLSNTRASLIVRDKVHFYFNKIRNDYEHVIDEEKDCSKMTMTERKSLTSFLRQSFMSNTGMMRIELNEYSYNGTQLGEIVCSVVSRDEVMNKMINSIFSYDNDSVKKKKVITDNMNSCIKSLRNKFKDLD